MHNNFKMFSRTRDRIFIFNRCDYRKFRSRSHDAVIRVYNEAGNVIETHEHAGEFKGDFVTRLGKRHARA
jgi:hypothetical protein